MTLAQRWFIACLCNTACCTQPKTVLKVAHAGSSSLPLVILLQISLLLHHIKTVLLRASVSECGAALQARQLAADLVTIVKQLIELNVKMRKIKVNALAAHLFSWLLLHMHVCSDHSLTRGPAVHIFDRWNDNYMQIHVDACFPFVGLFLPTGTSHICLMHAGY